MAKRVNSTINKYARQSFLGEDSQERISHAKVAIIGLGGGGSHIVQQLAHLGFQNYLLLDPDRIDETNLNRLVSGTIADVENGMYKVDIAKRTIVRLCSNSRVEAYVEKWHNKLDELKECDLIFGCVEGFIQRRDVEAFARRFLIPFIDIGMDVHSIDEEVPRIAGQIILSMPGYACMNCIRFLTDENLKKEASRYGDAGGNPQVVWSNGILASVAVGLAIDLITDWSKTLRTAVFLSYDGNDNTVKQDNRMQFINLNECSHYPLKEIGEPKFRPI